MISKLFLLLVVILIILGLYCSDKPIKLEKFSTPNLTGSKNKLYNNEYASPNNLNIGGLNVDNSDTFSNKIDYYDPEDKIVCGADYTDCNHTHHNIAGCTTKYEPNKASNFRKDATIEMYSNSSSADIDDGASQIYGRGLINRENNKSSKKSSKKSSRHPPRHPSRHPCRHISNKECSRCDILLNKDIDKYVLKSSVPPCPDMKDYAKKSMLCPCRDMSKYILKRDIPKCPRCPKQHRCPKPIRCPKQHKCPEPIRCPKQHKCPEPIRCPHINLDKYITRRECSLLRKEDKRLWDENAAKIKNNSNRNKNTKKDTRFSKYSNQPFNHTNSCSKYKTPGYRTAGYKATGEFYN